jgi:hypothetical protein
MEDILIRQLTPEERDDIVLDEELVLGSAYLKSKRKVLRRTGRKIRPNMYEPTPSSRRKRER